MLSGPRDQFNRARSLHAESNTLAQRNTTSRIANGDDR
jgi:hypothetical protein